MKDYSNQIEALLANESFVRWIEGRASKTEISNWEIWLQEDPARKKLKEEAFRIHSNFKFKGNKRADLEFELSKLNKAIDGFAEPSIAREGQGERFSRLYYPLVAAVAFLLIVLLGSLYLSYKPNEPVQNEAPIFLIKSTEFGEKRSLTLTDGSTILLNSNSTLKLPESHSGDLELWLKGEAYFDIVRKTDSEKRRVTVHTTDGNVQVLGTKFNVNTFNKGTEVVLKEGKVKVGVLDETGLLEASRTMEPGELSQFTEHEENIHIKRIKPELYTSWTNDKLIFEQTPIADIAERIEHIYGVEFIMMDPELGQTEISGSIPNNNLPIFLQALEKILQQPITRDNGKIQIGKAR